jgi:hypothetical protein
MSDVNEAWDSGLFQIRGPYYEQGRTIGHASLACDALGQSLASFVEWLPEGFMSNESTWTRFMYVFVNLVDSRIEVLFDGREDTGSISREATFPLPEDVSDDHPLLSPQEYSDSEVFAALTDAIRPTWQVELVEESTIAMFRGEINVSLILREFEETVTTIHRWNRPT